MKTEAKKIPVSERNWFLAVAAMVGGYINAYTFTVYNGFMTNGMTSNMTKFGLAIARADVGALLGPVSCILAAIAGSVLSECMRTFVSGKSDWRILALLVEAILFLFAALLPGVVSEFVLLRVLCLLVGYHLSLFRQSRYGAFNTTICTGNLRTLGQLLFAAVYRHGSKEIKAFLGFSALVFSFSLGCLFSGLLSARFGVPAILFPIIADAAQIAALRSAA